MKSGLKTLIAGLLSQVAFSVLQHGSQHSPTSPETPRIAIIGPGIAGASAAYHLHPVAPPGTSITIFESSSRIGGRVRSLPILDTYNRTFFETGASSFVRDDECLVQAMQELGLHLGIERFSGFFGNGWPYEKPTGVWDAKYVTGTPLLIQQLRSWRDSFGLTSLMDPVHRSCCNSFWENLRVVWLGGLKLDPRLQASCNFDSLSWWRRIHLRWNTEARQGGSAEQGRLLRRNGELSVAKLSLVLLVSSSVSAWTTGSWASLGQITLPVSVAASASRKKLSSRACVGALLKT